MSLESLGIGCEQLGGVDWGSVDKDQAVRAVRAACDIGVTLFDTANVYGLGESEVRLADALGSDRHDAVIVTKGGYRWDASSDGGRARPYLDLTPASISRSIDESLQRLRLSSIPLYLIHRPAPGMDLAALVETLALAKSEGRIQKFGFSNFSMDQLKECWGLARFDAVETEFNLLSPEPGREIISWAASQDVMSLAYGALGQGLLTGKYDKNTVFPETDRRHRLPHFSAEQLPDNLMLVDRVVRIATDLGRKPSQVAVRWCLDSAPLGVAVVGVKTTSQLDDLLASSEFTLDAEHMAFLEPGQFN